MSYKTEITYKCGHTVTLNSYFSPYEVSQLSQKVCLRCSIKNINIEKFKPEPEFKLEIKMDDNEKKDIIKENNPNIIDFSVENLGEEIDKHFREMKK